MFQRSIDEKFHCLEEKDDEVRRLQLVLREKDRDLERLRCVLNNTNDTITVCVHLLSYTDCLLSCDEL